MRESTMILQTAYSAVLRTLRFRKSFTRLLSCLLLLALAGAVGARAQGQRFGNPGKIAEGNPGQVLVSDSRGQKVFFLDKQTLEVLGNFSVSGKPIAVAALGDVILVSNRTTQALEVYGKRGNKLKLTGTIGAGHGNTNGPLLNPGDLAVDTIRQWVFVLDRADVMVKVFDLDGNLISEFSPLDSAGEVLAPTSIFVDEANSMVLVSDYGDPTGSFSVRVPPRVLIYDYAGTYLRQIDGDGVVDGVGTIAELAFGRPVGLAVNRSGHLFLVDCTLSQVFVFDLNNMLDSNSAALVKILGSYGSGDGQLNFPLDVLVDGNNGDVFVTNNGLGRLEVYRGEGNTP